MRVWWASLRRWVWRVSFDRREYVHHIPWGVKVDYFGPPLARQ
jgi:hypothetical protein